MSARDQQKIGFRIYKKVRRAAAEHLKQLEQVGVGDIADAMQGMNVADSGLRPAYTPMGRVFGTAITCDLTPGDGMALRAATHIAQKGDVIVVNAHGVTERAIMGGAAAMHMVNRGVVGLIVDGAIRDVEEFRALGLPTIVRATVPRSGSTASGFGEVNVPVACGGVVVHPGDIVVGDGEGVVVIPAAFAGSVVNTLGKTGHSAYDPNEIRAKLAELKPDSPVNGIERLLKGLKERDGVVIDGYYGDEGPITTL